MASSSTGQYKRRACPVLACLQSTSGTGHRTVDPDQIVSAKKVARMLNLDGINVWGAKILHVLLLCAAVACWDLLASQR